MTDFNFSPFRTTRIVQSEIQEFLDAVSMAVLAYQEGSCNRYGTFTLNESDNL